MITLLYKTKKELKTQIGKSLRFNETSYFGNEYKSNGWVTGCNHPKRSWFARVLIENDLIKKVE